MNHKLLYIILLLNLLLLSVPTVGKTTSKKLDFLENNFLNPPISVKPYVWCHWMGSNFSKAGITKDLEAMKAQGIAGATIFNLSSAVQESHAPTANNPWPNQTYRSPEYWDAIQFAASEAQRLGLKIGLHNTVGYSTTGGPWIDEPRSMQQLVWSDTTVIGGVDIVLKLKEPILVADEGWGKTGRKISYFKDIVVMAVPADAKVISLNQVINLTQQFNAESGLNWKVPSGNWIIYRICHASTGRPPHPVPDDLLGKVLEADKMSVEQSTFHWQNVLNPIKKQLGEHLGKSFNHILVDSYEAGNQNWTPSFRQEFMNRKGYDPIPWLMSFSASVDANQDSKHRRIIGNEEQSARFDWDYRDVISQLFFDNGWKIGKDMLKVAKLDLQMEPYEGPFNTPQGAALADLPIAEFWSGGISDINAIVPAAARAGGKTIVGAESFTGRPEISQYTEDPAFLKPSADKAFASGINRLILHHWVHQPFDSKHQPGMGMGWWGTHFGRFQTWFEPGKAFFTYMARCQAMLQYGEQPADYLCLDQAVGFSDVISQIDFLKYKITIEKGKIIVPSGRNYQFMVFPGNDIMLPEVAQKIKEMVAQGATIVSLKPTKSPSLKNFPSCDDELKRLADEVWGNGTSNRYKDGFVFTKLEDAIKAKKITSDFQIEKAEDKDAIKIAHRSTSDTDIYFISNQSDKMQQLAVSFRIAGKQPELWQAEDGSIKLAPVWFEKDGRTTVEIKLKGIQSLFVVFRKSVSKADYLVSVTANNATAKWDIHLNKVGKAVLSAADTVSVTAIYASGKQKNFALKPPVPLEITGSWNVAFVPKTDTPFDMDFSELIDFSKHNSNEVKYFAGTATYRKIVTIKAASVKNNQHILLDLGVMNDIAEVRINGKSAGILWYPPYCADITDLLRVGENKLEIAVTNNWANRMIGDEQEPADFEWGKDRGEKMGRALLEYPEWFIQNKPRPSQGRKSFSNWFYYRSDSPLKPAGLVGPVRLASELLIPLK